MLIDGLETVNEPDPDDRLPAIETSAVSVTGDLWQLGKHRVLCGDSLILENYDRLLDGAKADLVITDPPYNVVIDGHASGLGKTRHREFQMASGEMTDGEFAEFLGKVMALSMLSSQPRFARVLLHGLEAFEGDPHGRRTRIRGANESLCVGQEQRRHGKLLSQCT